MRRATRWLECFKFLAVAENCHIRSIGRVEGNYGANNLDSNCYNAHAESFGKIIIRPQVVSLRILLLEWMYIYACSI